MEIKPYSKNAKKHPPEQIEKIKKSIKAFGCKQPLVLQSDGTIVVGHGRYQAMQELGYVELRETSHSKKGDTFIPYILADDLTEEEIKAYRLADNKLNESDWDMKLVFDEIGEIESEELQEVTGFQPPVELIKDKREPKPSIKINFEKMDDLDEIEDVVKGYMNEKGITYSIDC